VDSYSDTSSQAATMNDASSTATPSFWRWRRPNFTNNLSLGVHAAAPSSTGNIADAVASLFGDPDISDVTLQGSDGGSVHAVRAILASRSTMFRQKLFGSKSNASLVIPGEKQVIKFKHWDCRILHMIVEYCYTDSCSLMKMQPNDEVARMVAQLRVAAKAFKLPGLLDTINQWGWRNVNRHPALACAMVDEGMKLDDIDDLALQTILLKPRASLIPDQKAIGSGVLSLTKPGLLFVLRTLEDQTSHLLLLHVIERWVDFSSEDSVTDSPSREIATREAFGRKCALRFVKTSKINPANFERAMKQSKLFQKRDDLTSVTLRDGLQFTEKSFKVEEQTERPPMRRPQTAIGLTRASDDRSKRANISQ
jgi:hypothetical protein